MAASVTGAAATVRERPRRDIPRAVLISITGFYLVGAYSQVAGYHFDLKAIGDNAGAPLFGLAGPAAGGGYGSIAIRRLLELVGILDMLRGLSDHPRQWAVYVASAAGIFVSGAVLFGSVYQVAPPTSWAAYAGVGVLVVGFALTMVFPGPAAVAQAEL